MKRVEYVRLQVGELALSIPVELYTCLEMLASQADVKNVAKYIQGILDIYGDCPEEWKSLPPVALAYMKIYEFCLSIALGANRIQRNLLSKG